LENGFEVLMVVKEHSFFCFENSTYANDKLTEGVGFKTIDTPTARYANGSWKWQLKKGFSESFVGPIRTAQEARRLIEPFLDSQKAFSRTAKSHGAMEGDLSAILS
jgi:hypothetical protein